MMIEEAKVQLQTFMNAAASATIFHWFVKLSGATEIITARLKRKCMLTSKPAM